MVHYFRRSRKSVQRYSCCRRPPEEVPDMKNGERGKGRAGRVNERTIRAACTLFITRYRKYCLHGKHKVAPASMGTRVPVGFRGDIWEPEVEAEERTLRMTVPRNIQPRLLLRLTCSVSARAQPG